MRNATSGVVLPLSLLSWFGCASAPPVAQTNLAASQAKAALEQEVDQTRRIAELEARIALLEADARNTRDADGTPLRSADTIRIGAAHSGVPDAPASTESASAEREPTINSSARASARTPVLRLYGKGSADVGKLVGGEARSGAREPLPDVPEVHETLPVAPLPEQRAKSQLGGKRVGDELGGSEGYRSALRHLHERRFDDAVRAFSTFIAENTGSTLLPNAFYWRSEALYAKRDYRQALAEFESVLARFPKSEKAPDALLKIGLCFRHLGAEDKAQASFRRLRETYPSSQAASIASREGST